MILTYDTKDFAKKDYEAFEQMKGFSCRESTAKGDNYRGMLIAVDSLMIKDIPSVLPKGYQITESKYKNSAGCIEKIETEKDIAQKKAVSEVIKTIQTRGEQAAIDLLADMTQAEIITSGKMVVRCLLILEKVAKSNDFANSNVLDVYRKVPNLNKCYMQNEKKLKQMQETFDKIVTKRLRLFDITNMFDYCYLRGLLELLHIEA
jgi:hypothetical protein